LRSNTSQSAPASQGQREQQQNDSQNGRPQQDSPGQEEVSKAASPWEWAIASVGAVAILSLIAFFIFQGVSGEKAPVDVIIQQQPVVPVKGGYLVPINMRNLGGNTAADLQVEGTLMDRAGNTIETSETTIGYLPPHSTQEGGLFFTENPRQYNLQLRPQGYEVP
jgi:uncharacterized protein (TIGR02588 family)